MVNKAIKSYIWLRKIGFTSIQCFIENITYINASRLVLDVILIILILLLFFIIIIIEIIIQMNSIIFTYLVSLTDYCLLFLEFLSQLLSHKRLRLI